MIERPAFKISTVAPVTAVIPCYNCAASLERAVTSVAEQSTRPQELILVDDASTDSTRQVIQELAKKFGFDWIRVIVFDRNVGPAGARNAAWNAARQPFVAFLDADDAWQQGKVEGQIAYMQAHKEVILTAHACRWVGSSNAKGSNTVLRGVRNLSCKSLLISNRIATRTVIVKSDIPYRFRDGKRYAEDYLLWLQIACDGQRIALLDVEWADVYKAAFGQGGLSGNLWQMEKGVLDAFWQLAKEQRLTRTAAFLCSIFSLFKFVRRVLLVAARRMQWSRLHEK